MAQREERGTPLHAFSDRGGCSPAEVRVAGRAPTASSPTYLLQEITQAFQTVPPRETLEPHQLTPSFKAKSPLVGRAQLYLRVTRGRRHLLDSPGAVTDGAFTLQRQIPVHLRFSFGDGVMVRVEC